MQSKPIVALASGAILAFGTLCQTVQAQDALNTLYSVNLADTEGHTSGNTVLNVKYEVTEPTPGDYFYSYTVNNTAGTSPVNFNDQADVTQFTVDFNASYSGPGGFSVIPGTITQGGVDNGVPNAFNGVSWFTVINYLPTGSSLTVGFQSDLPPTMGNASASGDSVPPSPWGSINSSEQVAVPQTPAIPEPATTSLFTMALMLLPFRSTLLKKK